MGLDAGWIEPQWPAPPQVRAVCTTRTGGVSSGPFASMNLGDHVGDAPQAVSTNRARLKQALQSRPVFMRQVHGTDVIGIDSHSADGLQADGAIASERAVACTVMVADCLPILLAHEKLPLVAALHAGWRGLAGLSSDSGRGGGAGIVEAGLQALTERAGGTAEPDQWLAWLGPCIGPKAFEVGAEVRQAFVLADAQAETCFVPTQDGKFNANLPALARRRLERAGLLRCYGNDGSDAWCTVRNSDFFSHRVSLGRDGCTGGRMAACIWLA